MSEQGFTGLNFDGLRTSAFYNCDKVIGAVDGLVEQYKNGSDECSMNRDDAEYLFNAINDLRQDICIFMCCRSHELGMGDLSHMVGNNGYIHYEEEDDEEEDDE